MMLFRQDIWSYQVRDALIYWVYIPLAVIGSGLLMDLFFGVRRFQTTIPLHFVAGCLLLLGGWLMQRAIWDLERFGSGTPNPRRPPKKLVTKGVYDLCRHPMFFGYDLAALGVVLEWRSLAMLLASFPLMLLAEILFLKKEENYLARRYGNDFAEYQRKVPMLLPSLRRGGRH